MANTVELYLDPKFADEAKLLRRLLADYGGDDLVDFDPASYRFGMDVLNALGTIPVPTLIKRGFTRSRVRNTTPIISLL